MKDILTTDQKKRLIEVHSYSWVEEGLSRDQILNRVESPEELYFLSFIIEWDIEARDFEAFIEHPYCDLGLALIIYWNFDPGDSNCLNFLNLIEEKVAKNEFLQGHISFDINRVDPRVLMRGKAHMRISAKGKDLPLDYGFIFE